ncbi:MAG: excinuclease ABC subunit UvrC [Thermodesulfobacteriota bacterium]
MVIGKDIVSTLPTSPGVYLMLDPNGKVLYVGKAGNLRARVRSYFVKGGDERPRIQFLLQKVDSIRTILTETEKEALILENNLIKEHRPPYNVNLRDDKSFFSLRLNVSHPFPRLTLVRTQKIRPDGERYFGPYSSARDAKITLRFILRLFPLRQCTERQFATCKRPCLNCQMKRCLCPCAGKVDPEEYARMVEGVSLLLQGRSEDLVGSLQDEMEQTALNLRFEEAARIRDRIASITRTLEVQNVSFFHLKDQDAIALVTGDSDLYVVQVLSFRRGNLLSEDSFRFRNEALEPNEVMASALKQYYGSAGFIPKEVLLSHPIESPQLIETWLSELRGNRVTVRAPSRGPGMRLVRLALKNAHNALVKDAADESLQKPLEKLAAKLHLPEAPSLIEGYDISNIAGAQPVGVKVAFRDGKPDKSLYRTFKMTGFTDQDDPGMIYQTVSRRLGHADVDALPDLFLIDGGKSQLNAAVAALKDRLGADIPAVAAIAKGREEGESDKIYLPNRKNPVNFARGDPALMFLMRIRDESHRFVHGFHTKSRVKAVIRSALDEVPGIGPKKRAALLKAFQSIDELLAASDEEIGAVEGINKSDIERLRAHFQEEPKGKIGLAT